VGRGVNDDSHSAVLGPTVGSCTSHRPVLTGAVVHYLVRQSGGVFLDATVGTGGHARAILESAGPTARLVAVDRDPEALAAAAETLQGVSHQVLMRHGDFAQLGAILDALGIGRLDGVLFDLGVSSLQLETARRGFSFQAEGPLDMRMDPGQDLSAATIVNHWPEDQLREIIARYGQERWARRIARGIVRSRPIQGTMALAQCIVRSLPRRRSWQRIHPATRTFQALRIAVNRELETLEAAVPQGVGRLRLGGRIVVLAYHSLEDRIVKHAFQRARVVGELTALTRKPLRASPDEVRGNPRARSARLRAGERTG